jgi:hypothetical protein
MLLEIPQGKLNKFITYSYGIQITHVLVLWNLLENEIRPTKKICHPNNIIYITSSKSRFWTNYLRLG